MAATGFTPISLYYTTTASAVPTAGNLVAGELALNNNDGKLFYKDSSGVVQTIASKAGNVNVSSFSGGSTGLTPNTATTGAITLAGTLAVANGGTGVTTSTGSGANVLGTTPSFATTVGVGAATAAASGAGVTFPATQSQSSDANTLDDYEEGTWTPSFTPGSGSITTQSGSGRYTKIGNMVVLTGTVTVTLWGTAAGGVDVTGMPFTNADKLCATGTEAAVNGKTCSGRQPTTGSTTFALVFYDNGGIASSGGVGATYIFSSTYRTTQ
jgi:hypothetical protein